MKKEAMFLLSKSALKRQFDSIKKEADFISYSFKTNPVVGKLLEETTKCYINISSETHLKKIKDKSRVWFFVQAWNSNEIRKLLNMGIDKFVIDNKTDLDVLKKFLERRNEKHHKKIWLLLRMKLKEHTIHTGKHFVFGMSADQVNYEITRLRNNRNIERLGVHVHRKTQNISEWSLKQELRDSLKKETLEAVSFINIGGGFPVDYKNSRADIRNIFREIRDLGKWLKDYRIKIMVEPGRFLAAPAIKLRAYAKSVADNNIIINCSVYNAAPDTFIANTRLMIEGETDDKNGKAYTIKGCTPDSVDIFRYKVYLKKKPKVGDEITFLNAGAYNFFADFDGLKKLKTKIIN